MTIIQSTDLESRGLLNDQSAALNIQGRWFKPGPAFTKSLLQTALEFCDDARVQGKQYLLIEFPTYFMAWRRVRPKKSAQPQAIAESPSEQTNTHSAQPQSSDPPQAVSDHQTPETIDAAFIHRCRTELAIHIGPMADFLIEQTLSQSSQMAPEQFVETLATHIADPKAVHAFRQQLS